jgi:MGT family glycosyltransferase
VRILLVTWDGGGNVPPALALSRRLTQKGYDVTVLGQEGQGPSFGGPRVPFLSTGIPAWHTPHGRPQAGESRTENTLVEMTFGPAVMGAVDDEIQRGTHDVVIVDCMMLGALTVAVSRGVPVVSLFHLLYGPTQIDGHWSGNYGPALPLLNAIRAQRGLPALTHVRRIWDEASLVLVATPPELDLNVETSARVRYVGPILEDVPSAWPSDLPWTIDDPTPTVLVSFSTNDFNQRAPLQRTVDAIADLPVHAVVTTGPAVDVGTIAAPSNVALHTWIAHREVLPAATAVVTHGGHSTVTAALAYGVPLVCIPTGADQHINAQRVEDIGVGRALPLDADVATLRTTIERVVESNSYRQAARAVQRTIDRLGRGARAVHEIEAVIDGHDALDLHEAGEVDEQRELLS